MSKGFLFFVVEAQFELGGSLGGNPIPNQIKAEFGEIRNQTELLRVLLIQYAVRKVFSEILICFSL